MKRINMSLIIYIVFLVLIIFILSIGSVKAATSCGPGNDDQVILSLYNADNSHGALPGETSATEKICYNNLFTGKYAGNNKQNCDSVTNPQNFILRLSTDKNAHAQKFEIGTYTTKICYGNLKCRVIGTGDCDTINPNPSQREALIVSLSSETNAHIRSPSEEVPYAFKVCCRSPTGTPNTLPFITITSPNNNDRFTTGANIEIKANAGDYDGTIVRVYFMQNGVVLGDDSTGNNGEFSFAWNNVPAGTYVLTAQAYDNLGASKISNPITIYVQTTPLIIEEPECNQNYIKEGNEQCDAGPNGGTVSNSICPTTRCQSNCLCDNLALSCEEDFAITGKCDPNSDAAKRDEKKIVDQTGCYDVNYQCIFDKGICTVDSIFALKNPLPSSCRNAPSPPTCCTIVESSAETGTCDNGVKTITVSYKNRPNSGCTQTCSTQTKTIPCGRNVASLPFVGMWQIIGVIVVIGMIYYFMFMRYKGRKVNKGKFK